MISMMIANLLLLIQNLHHPGSMRLFQAIKRLAFYLGV